MSQAVEYPASGACGKAHHHALAVPNHKQGQLRGYCIPHLQQVQANVHISRRGRHHHVAARVQSVHSPEAHVRLRRRAAQHRQVFCCPEARRDIHDADIAPAELYTNHVLLHDANCAKERCVLSE